ncbi:FeoB-associated Cys-rich membrane protein [Pseudoflavonifractor sp. 60]|nr:FeoB-associated Cys-rich membrane protein [Pseudoflavonifractor sp. 60]NBI68601.1 FeoB-associated Cys-rich membrane protein [Pseudoflavonifractor sp. 60]
MTPGDLVVVLVLAGLVGLAVRSLWKKHKADGCCNGDCSQCSSCHHK